MAAFEQECDAVVRAAYQVSGLTGSRVEDCQVAKVVPLADEEFQRVLDALETRGLISQDQRAPCMALTAEGLAYAATLPPVSEPPMFSDI